MAVILEGPRLLHELSVDARRMLIVLLLGVGAVGLCWYVIRLSFWGIAIVRDRLDPIAGLHASFSTTRGRWWKTLGLGMLSGCIFYGVRLPFGLIEVFGAMVGGGVAFLIWVLCSFFSFIVNLYVSFAVTAAYVRFYEDTKSLAGQAPAAAPS